MKDVKKEIESNIIKSTEQTIALKVIDNITYVKAGEFLVSLKSLEKKIKGYFGPIKKKAHEAWKGICVLENEELGKIQPALKHLNEEMTMWNILQEEKRRMEEDRLRREVEKSAEEKRLAAAIEAEKSGNKKEAEEILDEPIFVPPPIVSKTVPKIVGQSMATTYKWRLLDIEKVPRQYLIIDEKAINVVVGALKGKTRIEGIEVYAVSSMRGVRQ